MSQTFVIPKTHITLLSSILEKMGCTDFKENKQKYAPDFSFSVGSEHFWGYEKGFTVEFNGTEPASLVVINQQYELILKQINKQETQD